MSRGNCKQCYYYDECLRGMPENHPCGTWNSIEDKRNWMIGHMMDCFKSIEQHRRDLKSAKKSYYEPKIDIPKDITLPKSLKHVDDKAFSNCESINKIELTKEINNIGPKSFDEAVLKFHTSRVAFAIVDNKIHTIRNDTRSHDKWLREEFGIGSNEFESIPRGYIKGYKVQLYIGKDFRPILSKTMLNQSIEKIVAELSCGYPLGVYRIYNGLIPGKPGEEWVYKEYVGEVNVI